MWNLKVLLKRIEKNCDYCKNVNEVSRSLTTYNLWNHLLVVIIDLVLTTNEKLIDNIIVTNDDCFSLNSEHKVLAFNLALQRQPKQSVNRVVYDYSKGDFDGLINALSNTPLLDIVLRERHDVNIAWTKWKNTFLNVVDWFVPKINLKRS